MTIYQFFFGQGFRQVFVGTHCSSTRGRFYGENKYKDSRNSKEWIQVDEGLVVVFAKLSSVTRKLKKIVGYFNTLL
jgi:hypothetical protein